MLGTLFRLFIRIGTQVSARHVRRVALVPTMLVFFVLPAGGHYAGSKTLPITSITPVYASTLGGKNVVIKGDWFLPGVKVLFGQVEALEVVVLDRQTIHAVAPPHHAGRVGVTVINRNGIVGVKSNAFLYSHNPWARPSPNPLPSPGMWHCCRPSFTEVTASAGIEHSQHDLIFDPKGPAIEPY